MWICGVVLLLRKLPKDPERGLPRRLRVCLSMTWREDASVRDCRMNRIKFRIAAEGVAIFISRGDRKSDK